MGKIGKYLIPFDADGNQMTYCTGYDVAHYGATWQPNLEFVATLRYVTFERGRSAAHLYFEDVETDKQYVMFLIELDDILKHNAMHGNCVTGRWTFTKRGQNYGVKWLGQPETPSREGRQ